MGVRGMRRLVLCAPESGRVSWPAGGRSGALHDWSSQDSGWPWDGTRWPAYEAPRARP
jgi:hypothetical protein